MSPPLHPGALVGRYRLEHVLGRGGMGEVWAAMHTATSRRSALKFLRGPVHLHPDARRRFLREARAATAVNHPNVVQIHDFFELEDGTPVMVMDLLHGETFGERLKREVTLSLVEAVNVLLPVVSAVGTAHSLGIVHRDLKPDNVFLARRPTGGLDVRVLDFGIAKLTAAGAAGNETGGVTDTGTMLGTPCYMSPEQSFGEKDVDRRADVWALGVMLYEALSGSVPVVGENLGQFVKRLVTEGITPLEVLVPNLPESIYLLVGRMLSRDRERRPSDLREVWETLLPFATVQAPGFNPAVSERPLPESDAPANPSTPQAVVVSRPSSDPEAETDASPGVGRSGTDGAQSVSVRRSVRRGRSGFLLLAVAAGVGTIVTFASLASRGPSKATSASAEATAAAVKAPAAPVPTPPAGSAEPAVSASAVPPVVSVAPLSAAAPSSREIPAPSAARAKGKREHESGSVPLPSASAAPAPSTPARPAQTTSPGLIDDLPF